MSKSEFLAALREKLNGVPEDDINKSLDFYGEMIDDRVEDGMSEEEAAEVWMCRNQQVVVCAKYLQPVVASIFVWVSKRKVGSFI